MDYPLVSVIIPIYNGETFIRSRLRDLYRQDYPNLEIILVENGSKDGSWDVCRKEAEQNPNKVRAFRNEVQGTSLARKRGVEEAKGEYILFSDQDDVYANRRCISDMVRAIREDKSQICQFSHYNQYFPGVRRKRAGNRKKIKYSRQELMNGTIGGVLGQPDGIFDTTVWSKIYDAAMLKAAVRNIDRAMFFAEDMYLNMLAFFNEKTETVSVRPDAYYVLKTGIGFSSTFGSGRILFREYEQVKQLTVAMAKKYELPEAILRNCHIETLYFHKNLILQIWDETQDEELCLKEIAAMEAMPHLHLARDYIQKLPPKEKWDELAFMAESHLAKEILNWCRANRPVPGKKERVFGLLAKLRK